jgi:hypothetical protein
MYPYTQNTGTLIGVIKQIGKNGIPPKFTVKEMPVWGYKSSNDRNVVGILRQLGFLDAAGVPSELWKEARAQPESAVAKGARGAYAELFQTFPDAHRKDSESLANFFKAKTSVGDAVIKQMVGTFKALAAYRDFERATKLDSEDQVEVAKTGKTLEPTFVAATRVDQSGLTINLNIELSIPVDTTGDVYDKFFASMKKHLIDAM